MDLANLTGPQLKALRRKMGINQTDMGKLIGTKRQTISYWETKAEPFGRYEMWLGKPAQMLQALGFELPYFQTSIRASGRGVLHWRDSESAAIEREYARLAAKRFERAARHRHPCGAQTRNGRPCRLKSEPGRTRCKFHGGKSTGPRTAEGKAQIAEAQRKRWASWRAERL